MHKVNKNSANQSSCGTDERPRWCWRILGSAILATHCSGAFGADSATPVKDLKKALIDYFADLDRPLIPVLVPRGQEVGNIYDLKRLEAIADRQDCFPQLHVPPPIKTNLPGSIKVSGLSGGLYFFVKSVFSAGVSGMNENNVVISFREPTVQVVTATALRSAWAKAKCSDLAPFLKAGLIPKADAPQAHLLIVGEVYRAKIDVIVTTSSVASARALLDKAVARKGSFGVNAEIKDGTTLLLQSEESLPVAVAPALIPVRETSILLGGNDPGKIDTVDEFEWRAYEPKNRPSQAKDLRSALKRISAEEGEGAAP